MLHPVQGVGRSYPNYYLLLTLSLSLFSSISNFSLTFPLDLTTQHLLLLLLLLILFLLANLLDESKG